MNSSLTVRPTISLARTFPSVAGVLLLAGCTVTEAPPPPPPRREVVVVEAPPPPPPRRVVFVEAPPPPEETVVVEVGAPPPVREVVVVEQPPPLRTEVIVARPSPRHFWIAGHWHHDGTTYRWISGRWVLPPSEGAVWVAPRYERRASGSVFLGGYWRRGGVSVAVQTNLPPPNVHAPAVAIIREPPPPPHEEVASQRPSHEHVWIRGYWRHDGRVHVWVRGHWERPPRRGCVWVEPRWERREGGYVFIPGCWIER